MSANRARREPGWEPWWSTEEALAGLPGLPERHGGQTAPLVV